MKKCFISLVVFGAAMSGDVAFAQTQNQTGAAPQTLVAPGGAVLTPTPGGATIPKNIPRPNFAAPPGPAAPGSPGASAHGGR